MARWQDRVGRKLVDVETAIARIESGHRVAIAPYTSTPLTLCRRLMERGKRGEIQRVRIDHPASGVSWTEPWMQGVFELHDNYATLPNRDACHAGRMEYLPVSMWRADELPPGFDGEFDVFLVPVSPLDARARSCADRGGASRLSRRAAERRATPLRALRDAGYPAERAPSRPPFRPRISRECRTAGRNLRGKGNRWIALRPAP